MRELEQISHFVSNRDIKKADVLIARQFKTAVDAEEIRQLYILRARTRLIAGRPDDALDDLTIIDKPYELNTNLTPVFYETLGDAYFARFELASVGFTDRSDTSRAQIAYERLIADYPTYSNIGWIYYQQGRIALTEMDISRAETLFQKALLNPSHLRYLPAYCYERLGFIAYSEHRDWMHSLAFLDRASNTYPAGEDANWLVQVHILRSKALKMMGDLENAISASETAYKLSVSSSQVVRKSVSEACLNIGEVLSTIPGREKDTLHYLDQFIHHTKRPPGADVTWSRVYEMRANAHFTQGKYDEAISDYNVALQFNPDHPWELSIYQQIARCYYQKRDYVSSIEVLKRIQKIAQSDGLMLEDFQIYDLLGNALFALQHYNAASEAYKSALMLVPPNTEASQRIRSYYELALDMARKS